MIRLGLTLGPVLWVCYAGGTYIPLCCCHKHDTARACGLTATTSGKWLGPCKDGPRRPAGAGKAVQGVGGLEWGGWRLDRT